MFRKSVIVPLIAVLFTLQYAVDGQESAVALLTEVRDFFSPL